MRRAERDRTDRRAFADGREAVERGSEVGSGQFDGRRWRTMPPSAVARSGASGVMPTAWKSATAPVDAATAPSAFRSSSVSVAGSPTMTGTALPAR